MTFGDGNVASVKGKDIIYALKGMLIYVVCLI